MGYMYDRNDLNGSPEVPMTEIDLNGGKTHVTEFDRETNERFSWDADGDLNSKENAHYTNQNVAKGSPGRH